jgi:hypothetical protein
MVLALAAAAPAGAAALSGDTVALVVAGTPAEADGLGSHLRPLIAGRGLVLELRSVPALDLAEVLSPPPAAPGIRARVWVDLRDRRQATVFFATAAAERTAVRTVPLASDADAVATAEIGEIVLAALDAPALGIGPAEPTAAEPAPVEASAAWGWAAGLVAAGEAWAGDAPAVATVGASLLVHGRRPDAGWSPGVWSLVRYRVPFESDGRPVRARLRGGELDLLFDLGRSLRGPWSLGLAAGAGADLRIADPVVAAGETLAQARQQRDLVLLIRAAVRIERGLGDHVALWLAAAVDAAPLQGRFVVLDGSAARTLLRPWPVRPSLLLGVALSPERSR